MFKELETNLANPNPEYLIKSIAEQGYNLETALADLVDNSISANANRIEVLTSIEKKPFTLYLADNGDGMDKDSLYKNMRLPSDLVEHERKSGDLGRFGLGLKTASFSQTRCFTVLSRKRNDIEYCGLTWDVNYLKKTNEWRIIVNSRVEIESILKSYKEISSKHLNNLDEFTPNTIIVWHGLYKYEDYEEDRAQEALKDAISHVDGYLSLVFHRFMEKGAAPLKIRINNILVTSFNPFPTDRSDFRALEPSNGELRNGFIRIQGYVLPNISIKESKENKYPWAPLNKSLMDMEGIYVYRADRLILFGGWNNIIKKAPKLQLARLKVDIGNNSDYIFHLNVAKSQIDIPYELKNIFMREIIQLRIEAQKEYYNFGINAFTNKTRKEKFQLYDKVATDKGVLLVLNSEYPLLKNLKESLNREQNAILNTILKISNGLINKIRQVESVDIIEKQDNLFQEEDLLISINKLLELGVSKADIKQNILPSLQIKDISAKISQLLDA